MSILNLANKDSNTDSCKTLPDNENSPLLDTMVFESWEKLQGESCLAFNAFCAFRDFGPERNIKKVVSSVEHDTAKVDRKYRTWRIWSAQFHWNKRASDYDKYIDKLCLAELHISVDLNT